MDHHALVADALDSAQLNLILLPTEKCNFACSYCYEDHIAGAMTESVICGVERLIERRAPKLRSLRISWFGGEPLLQLAIIERICRYCTLLAERLETLEYVSDMTTNGFFLTGPLAERLSSLGVKTYQISLDGAQAQHDKTRIRRGGQGTFSRIYQNLLDIRDTASDLRVIIRVHFSAATYQGLDPLIDRVNADFGDDPRFTVHFKAIEPLGGPNNHAIVKIDRAEQARIYALLSSKLRLASQREPLESLAVCYASVGNSFLIYPNGDIGKCTVALHQPENVVGSLAPDGRMQIHRERFLGWLRGLETGDPDWLACPWRKFKEATEAESGVGRSARASRSLPLIP